MCVGEIDSVTIVPSVDHPHYTAVMVDGAGKNFAGGKNQRLRIIWLGRRRVPGIAAGTRLRVEGMVALRDGLPTMYNPRYEIIGSQES